MAFISSTILDATKVGSSVTDITKLQSGITASITPISNAASSAVSGTVLGGTSGIAGGIQGINGTLGSASKTVSSITQSVGSANSFLQSAVKSITSTFEGGVKGLASGLDSALKDIFKETNVKTASTTTSQISDPVKTNLLAAKTPISSAFKIGSLEVGSQAITMSGANSQFGTNANSMVGTNLSTLLNRFNLDSTSNVANGITKSNSSSAIKSLFSSVSSIAKTAGSVISTVKAVETIPNQLAKSLNNELQSFIGRASAITQLTGIDASSYFTGSTSTSVIDNLGNKVTSTSAADSQTLSTLLSAAAYIGCNTGGVNEYKSVNELESLYNLILSLASSQGISSLVSSLLGCSMSSSTAGQSSILNALLGVASSDITVTNVLLSNVTDTTTLYKNQQLAKSIISNNNLTSKDTTAVKAALAALGYTPTEAYELTIQDNGSSIIYDSSILTSSEKSILDNLFEDKALSTYVNATAVSLLPDGTLWA